MATINKELLEKWAKQGTKTILGDAMEEAVVENEDVIILAADLAKALGVYGCSKIRPKQYYNLGIAEQNMIGVACGLAKEGKIPVATSFTPFLTLRALEQIRTCAAYMNLNVKMAGGNAGVKGGQAASSHYGLEDIAVMRAIPNMTVLSPCDGLSMYKAAKAMLTQPGPAYLRLAGNADKIVYTDDFDFVIGKAIQLREGQDVIIFATGPMVQHSLQAAESLKKRGINAGVYDMHTIKPLDKEAILSAAEKTPLIVTVEEHTVIGGLGSAVAEVLSQSKTKARQKILGLGDRFMKIASYERQLEKCGLLPEQLTETIEAELKNRA